MPRNWRCANGHAWTGDLGALTFCPDCGTADVYEVRPEYHSGEHPALKDAPPPPADDAFGRTFIQPAAAPAAGTGDTFIQMRPHAAGDTFVQAPPVAAGAGDTLMQPVLEVSTDEMLAAPPFDPADPGTTL